MRDDKEKSITSEQTKVIIEQLFSDNAEIKNFDTIINADKPIIGEYREKLVIGKLKEFADCETVVTDRLHGMIFSYITSTPCVAIPNSTGKSLYVYNDWLKDSKVVYFFHASDDAIQMPQNEKSLDLDFTNLKKALQSNTEVWN